jgi:three-Cys-motif partner protein
VANDSTVWELEPHTRAKHEILRRYLNAWFPIMSSFARRVVYIDGFAGPGEYTGGVKGSPIIAVEVALEHRGELTSEIVFIFIEKDEARCGHLKRLLQELGDLPENFVVHDPVRGSFDEEMTDVLDFLDEQRKALAPTFAMVDPFGFSGTPMSVIGRIMSHQRCEVFITFMYEYVNRFIEHPSEAINKHMDALYGTDAWRGVTDHDSPAARRRFLHDLYRDQLNKVAGIEYVRSFEMINEGNRTEYFLFFGSNHYLGLKKMKYAMWQVDPGEGMQFSDFTQSDQQVLFEPEPNLTRLRDMILRWGSGSERSVEEVERFVVVETPFAHTQYKRGVLSLLEKEGTIEVVASNRKKRFSFPEGTVIRFP